MDETKVMIVEDNTTVAMDIRECLTNLGFLVTGSVVSGEEAIASAGRDRPDVVLMDVKLRGDMDGIEAAKRIHAELHIPTLFLSAYNDRDLLERAKQAGSFGYLVKPFEVRELQSMLEMTLHKARAERERERLILQLQDHQDELRRIQDELTASRDRYLDLFQGSPVGYLLADDQDTIVDANQTLARMLGLTIGDVVGKPLSAFTLAEDQDVLRRHLLVVRAHEDQQAAASCELRLRGAGGEPLWARLDTVQTESTSPRGVSRTTIIDIGAQKRAEQASAEQQRLAAFALESLPHPALVIKKDRTVVMANRMAVAAGAVPGEPCWKGFHHCEHIPEDHKRHLQEHGEPPPGGTQCVFCRADQAMGQGEPCEAREVEASGRIWDIFWMPLDQDTCLDWAVDITQRKQAEERSRERQRMESLGVLAGGVAHHLNNMLGAITGYSELALEALSPGSEIRGFIEQQLVAATRASQTVEQILEFSRRSELNKRVIDLGALARETVGLLQRLLPSSVNLHLEVAPDVPPVSGDGAQLQQVIMSLCTNARDAMPDGGDLALVLTAHHVDPSDAREDLAPGLHAHLEVRDTGSGIPPEVRTRVFEPFFTTKATGQGTGMGLATAYGIVTGHGGLISAESKVGVGSIFHVHLPAAGGKPAVDCEPVDEVPLDSARVLVVDDEPTVLEMASALLRSLGCHVTSFSSSEDALSALELSPDDWDVVMTDQTMPCHDGLEVLRRVKNLRPDLPVVLMTGHSGKITDDSDGGVGADAVLRKPFRRRALAETMQALLGS